MPLPLSVPRPCHPNRLDVGYSLLALTLGLAGPLVAWLMGRIGSRWTIFIGGLVAAGGATLVATTSAYPLYLIGAGVLLGLGVAMQTILPGTTMVTNWFARRRSLAMGIFLTAGGLGGFIAAPTISSLIAATGTYRTAWWAIAVSGVAQGTATARVLSDAAGVGCGCGDAETRDTAARPLC